MDASPSISKPAGSAASPLFLWMSSVEHQQKPPSLTSALHPSLKIQTPTASLRGPPSIVWRDLQTRESKMVEEVRKPDYENPRDHISNVIPAPFTSTQRPREYGEYFKQYRPHSFFTKALIETPRGYFDLQRVLVDEKSLFNLIPWSIAANLNLVLYSGKTLTITIADRLVRTDQYSQFTIRIAGRTMAISTIVVSGLQTILLGREWIRSVHLLSDSGNQNYYIPVPLPIVWENFPTINTKIEAKDIKPVEMEGPGEMEEYDKDEFRKADEDEDEDEDKDEDEDEGEDEEYDQCEGCEEYENYEYEEYDECDECEEYHGYKEREHKYQEGEEDSDVEQIEEAHYQQSESKMELAAHITKQQSKEISNLLKYISRTPAGQNFKAPVQQLWPEFAGVYVKKVPNPIDLGTIQGKVKNNIYSSLDDLRADVLLLYKNRVDFNGIDHIITSTALEIRDTILDGINNIEEGKRSIRRVSRLSGGI